MITHGVMVARDKKTKCSNVTPKCLTRFLISSTKMERAMSVRSFSRVSKVYRPIFVLLSIVRHRNNCPVSLVRGETLVHGGNECERVQNHVKKKVIYLSLKLFKAKKAFLRGVGPRARRYVVRQEEVAVVGKRPHAPLPGRCCRRARAGGRGH